MIINNRGKSEVVRSKTKQSGYMSKPTNKTLRNWNKIKKTKKCYCQQHLTTYLSSGSQLRCSKFIRDSPEHFAYLILQIFHRLCQEILQNGIITEHWMASNQCQPPSQTLPSVLNKLRISCCSTYNSFIISHTQGMINIINIKYSRLKIK